MSTTSTTDDDPTTPDGSRSPEQPFDFETEGTSTSWPPGWYPNPDGPPGELRFWDGLAWSDHTSRVEPSLPSPPTDPPLVAEHPTSPPAPAPDSLPRRIASTEPDQWKLTPIRRFLIFASGAVPRLLIKSPTDIPGMIALGAIVTSVGVISALSMTFALSMAFDTALYVMAPFGVVWGAIIFNLDRWLLASARKMPNIFADFLAMLPRLALALLIGFVVSEPLVLRVFETAIEDQLVVEQAERVSAAQERRDNADGVVADNEAEIATLLAQSAPVVPELAAKQAEIAALRAEIDATKATWDEAERSLTEEVEGLSRTGMSGCGPTCRLKSQTRDLARAEYERVNERNTAQIDQARAVMVGLESEQRAANERFDADRQSKVDRLNEESASAQANAQTAYERELEDRPAGILERMRALHEVEKQDSTLRAAHWALAAMLIALDVLPVLGKFLNNRGPRRVYDMLVAAEEEDVAARIEAHSEARDAEAALSMSFLSDNHELRRTIEAENSERYLRHVGAVHADIARGIVQEWERNEKARVFADLMARTMVESGSDPAFDWLRPHQPSNGNPPEVDGNDAAAPSVDRRRPVAGMEAR